MLHCGIIGLPMVGKTTLFNLLTEAHVQTSNFFSGKTETNVGVAKIPDKRIDFCAELYKPRRTIYAQIEFIDVVGLVKGASKGQGVGNEFLNSVRNVDALVHVVRLFQNPDVIHVEETIDPLRDIETINMELLFSDLEIVEKRIEKINSGKKKKEQDTELKVLLKCKECLENELPIHTLNLSDEEKNLLKGYTFLTEKPMILVANLDEKQLKSGEYPGKEGLKKYAAARGIPVVEISARIEEEINSLGEEDKDLFMEDLGLTEPGIERLARAVYDHLGLISFFTVGEDEVRAWTIEKNTDAKRAAGKIHSDIERGFIRAEVVRFEDLAELKSMAKVKEKGLFRLEGKDYIVQDGDIINFRFNV